MTAPVTVTLDGAVAILQMHDPARRNVLGAAMLDALSAGFDALPAETRVVILRASADAKVWCAGFDIRSLSRGADPLDPAGPLHGLFHRIADCPAPVIAMLHGTTWGGGTDLAIRCDILIADPTCTLAFTPARLGLPYDTDGLRNALLRAGPALAMEMFATADPVPAERALRAGLINHLVPEAELEAFTTAMARRIADNAPLSVASAKRQLRAIGSALTPAELERIAASRRTALDSDDYAEGLAAFVEKRAPGFGGS